MKRLLMEGSVPVPPKDEEYVLDDESDLRRDEHDFTLLTEQNVAGRVLNETGDTVYMMLRNDRCLLTGRVREENVDKIRTILTGFGVRLEIDEVH